MRYLSSNVILTTTVAHRHMFLPIILNNIFLFGPPKHNNESYKHISFATPESDFTAPTYKEFINLFKL
jgi:hypothetical protein